MIMKSASLSRHIDSCIQDSLDFDEVGYNEGIKQHIVLHFVGKLLWAKPGIIMITQESLIHSKLVAICRKHAWMIER